MFGFVLVDHLKIKPECPQTSWNRNVQNEVHLWTSKPLSKLIFEKAVGKALFQMEKAHFEVKFAFAESGFVRAFGVRKKQICNQACVAEKCHQKRFDSGLKAVSEAD